MLEFVNNGLRLEYEVTGHGLPFVFLHGMGGSINQIYTTYAPIEGVQLITINQQGHGNSDVDWDKYDFSNLADDIVSLLEYLNIKKACFAGISMGAAVSLNVATRYPECVQKLLLIRNAWTDQPMLGKVQAAYHDLGMSLKEDNIEAFYRTEGWRIVKKASAYTRNAFIGTFHDPCCIKNWRKYLILPKKTPISSLKELNNLTMPVSILANRNDLCHPFAFGEYLRDSIVGAELVEIPEKEKAGHKNGINLAIRHMLEIQ